MGSPSTRASMMTPKVSCSCECLYSWLRTTLGLTSRRSSMTMRMPSRSDSSRSAVMPSTCFSRCSSAIFSISGALLTMYGISVTTIRCLPPCMCSIWALARMRSRPRPVAYASRMPSRPRMSPPVGKSGPLTCFIESSTVTSGLSMRATSASITSPRLCGGMLVAMPTAMPDGAVHQQVGKAGREGLRLLQRIVEVGDEVDGVLVDVAQHLHGEPAKGGPPCSAWPPAGRRRCCRSCRGRPPAGSGRRSPGAMRTMAS